MIKIGDVRYQSCARLTEGATGYGSESWIKELSVIGIEQTETDLFFISAKIQKKLLEGEKKENIQEDINKQVTHQSVLQQIE